MLRVVTSRNHDHAPSAHRARGPRRPIQSVSSAQATPLLRGLLLLVVVYIALWLASTH